METQTVFEIKANLENLWKEFSENHAFTKKKETKLLQQELAKLLMK